MANKLGRLKSIEVRGLFGEVDYDIDLDPSRPTVLTGSNGTGKSTLLRLVNAISNADLVTIVTAPVNTIRLVLDGIANFKMTRLESDEGFALTWGRRTGTLTFPQALQDLPDWAMAALEDRRFDVDSTLNDLSDVAQGSSVPFDEYRESRDALSRARHRTVIQVPEWYPEFTAHFPVLFVSDQRLVSEYKTRDRPGTAARPRNQPRTSRLAVEVAANEMAGRIREADSDYARSSQTLDRYLPDRIIESLTKNKTVSPARLAELFDFASERRDDLRSVGLLDINRIEAEPKPETLHDANVRSVMYAVVSSTLEKLRVFDDLEARLSSFKSFLDDRFSPKKLELSRTEGMRFRLPGGRKIRPRQLSSGEQQITVLAYEILFKATQRTLVIVDEPELSLHVLWQDTLVRDLVRMGEASGVQFLMATHSPVILGDYPDLERPLEKVLYE